MNTQTWAYVHAQLDFPKSKQVKIHILRKNSNRSFCGLENRDDEGEMTWKEYLDLGIDACSKCRKAILG